MAAAGGGLDSFLNIAIPVGIVIFFIGIMYWKMKDPLNQLFHWLKGLFSSASDKIPSVNLPTEIVYR